MGVTGLWTVVAPTARPTQLATLNRKRLAVDASIWIYQFLKAVRDKEGNALRNSHVVGFFRRICKLLYFGIKPVFVFDGGAPILKRETVRKRARRREGRREDAARTAGKLLAVQVARAAEEEEKRRKAERERTPVEEELPAEQELVYVDELGMSKNERQAGRGFKRKDQYHLPDLDVSIESLGAPNDPRIMSQAELEEYARQFHSGEDINLYDFSKIDFESPFFLSLPAGDRYNILNAARLRSRLRMGYSKEQLDGMFPDRMAFSKFQIERVTERNELTQRLMHVNGMAEDFLNQGGRIAGEKGKEYVLVRNDGVEGGWALGVVSNKQGTKRENAIDLEEDEDREIEDAESEETDFEDVAIEGLNRIPKSWQKKPKEVDYDDSYEDAAAQIARKRKAVYGARKAAAEARDIPDTSAQPHVIDADGDGLFVPQDNATQEDDDDDLFEDVNIDRVVDEDDDDLQRAIAMSLNTNEDDNGISGGFLVDDDSQNIADKQHTQATADDDFDLQAALAESRKSKHKPRTNVRKSPTPKPADAPQFSGPLPFESLNLGQSLLGKKKSKKVEEDLSGGFDRKLGDDAFRKERPAQPTPSWFKAAPTTNDLRQPRVDEDREIENQLASEKEIFGSKQILRRGQTDEVIDVDAEDEEPHIKGTVDISSDEEPSVEPTEETHHEALDWEIEDIVDEKPDAQEELRRKQEEEAREERYRLAREIAGEDEEEETTQPPETKEPDILSMDQVAEHAQAQPPPPTDIPDAIPSPRANQKAPSSARSEHEQHENEQHEDEADIDWSESDIASQHSRHTSLSFKDQPIGRKLHRDDQTSVVESDEDEAFEDVEMQDDKPSFLKRSSTFEAQEDAPAQFLISDDEEDDQNATADAAQENVVPQADFDYLSDSDEELMRQLAIESEEHARFASSLNNNKTPAETARDYENELKQLRNQQKKDRRDADEVTQVMVQECQALLRLFGLPYITAPMEAEAQCAELVHLGLVDGIVTDDSDIFLFGGTRIYKNMFNAAKFVECYLATDLEKEYALDRKKLIRFAHLLGSDYTEGIPGVGPVTALEIITDFSTLEEFKEWCAKVQLGRPSDLESQLTTPFRRKFRNTVQKKLFLPTGFPDVRVDLAYLNPEVDADPQEFQWGVPDLDKLRSFLMATIGWNQDRTDEILVPVIRDMNKRGIEGTQANITRFFSGGVGIGAAKDAGAAGAPRDRTGKESGRMKNAYTRLRSEAERKRREEDDDDEHNNAMQNNGKAIGADGDIQADTNLEEPRNGQDDVGKVKEVEKAPARRPRKTKKHKRATSSSDEVDNEELADDENFQPPPTKKKRRRRQVELS